jgi:hypothetical protein
MTKLSDYVPAVVVYWTESEAGWGQSSDGMSIYLTEDLAKKAIDKHWDEEEDRNPSGITPSCYVFPSEPSICLITKEKYNELPKTCGYHTDERNPPWFKARL